MCGNFPGNINSLLSLTSSFLFFLPLFSNHFLLYLSCHHSSLLLLSYFILMCVHTNMSQSCGSEFVWVHSCLILCKCAHHILEIPLPLTCGILSSRENRPLPLLPLSSQWGEWCGTIWAREWLVAPVSQLASTLLHDKTHFACRRTGNESTIIAIPMWKSVWT